MKPLEVLTQRLIYVSEGLDEEHHQGWIDLLIVLRANGEHYAIISDLFVEESERRKGIGSYLVEKAVAVAEKHDCYKMVLECATHNVPFYEQLGFTQNQIAMRKDLKVKGTS